MSRKVEAPEVLFHPPPVGGAGGGCSLTNVPSPIGALRAGSGCSVTIVPSPNGAPEAAGSRCSHCSVSSWRSTKRMWGFLSHWRITSDYNLITVMSS